MKIIFLTISMIDSIEKRGIYTDLMRKFWDEGHDVYIISPIGRQYRQFTELKKRDRVNILRVKTLNVQKTNSIEKGLGLLLIEFQFKRAIQKYFKDVKFDLILYSTPPITFSSIIRYLKQKHGAKTYLLLKDIFPQNAVDIGLIDKESLIYKYFRKREKETYNISDHIGCMSPANVAYVKKHNLDINPEKIELCPNSIEVRDVSIDYKMKIDIRKRYGISNINTTVFIYGGNLGKPQGVDFFKKILISNNKKSDCFFLIVGSGTEYENIKEWFNTYQFTNAKIIQFLPKAEYDDLVRSCDVGLIFLDRRFTIPNYPSRLLSYMESKIPIILATDNNTDIGKIAEDNKYGISVLNGDIVHFNQAIEEFILNKNLVTEMGNNGFNYLKKKYTVDVSYQTIIKHFS
jgi:glycosyltransferase involved in cell wall biosynthesis